MSIIEHPTHKSGKHTCDLCVQQSLDLDVAPQDVKDFSLLYSGGNNGWTFTICKEHAEEIALFLIRAWSAESEG